LIRHEVAVLNHIILGQNFTLKELSASVFQVEVENAKWNEWYIYKEKITSEFRIGPCQ
jgi:hypothetical protein